MWPLKGKTIYESLEAAITIDDSQEIPVLDAKKLERLRSEIKARNARRDEKTESLLDKLFGLKIERGKEKAKKAREVKDRKIKLIMSNKGLSEVLKEELGKKTLEKLIFTSGNVDYFRLAVMLGKSFNFSRLYLLDKEGEKGLREIHERRNIDAVSGNISYLEILLKRHGFEEKLEYNNISDEKITELYLFALNMKDRSYIDIFTTLIDKKGLKLSGSSLDGLVERMNDRMRMGSVDLSELLWFARHLSDEDLNKIKPLLEMIELSSILKDPNYISLFNGGNGPILSEKINKYMQGNGADLNSIAPLLLRIKEELPSAYAKIDIPAAAFDLTFFAHPDHAELYELWAPKIGLYGYKGKLITHEADVNEESRCFAQLRCAIQENKLSLADFTAEYLNPGKYSTILNRTLSSGGVVSLLNKGDALSIIDFAFDNNNREYIQAILEAPAFDLDVCGRKTALQYILEPIYSEFDDELFRLAMKKGASLTQFICRDRGDPKKSTDNLMSVKSDFANDLAFRVALKYANPEVKFDSHYAEQDEAEKLAKEAIKFGDDNFVGVLAAELKLSEISVQVDLSRELNKKIDELHEVSDATERATLLRGMRSLIILAGREEKIDAVTASKLLRIDGAEEHVGLLLERDPTLATTQYALDYKEAKLGTVNLMQEMAVIYQQERGKHRREKLQSIFSSQLSKLDQVTKLLEDLDNKGNNIFHYICFAGIMFDGLPRVLQDNKASLQKFNKAGKNPLEIAVMAGQSDFLFDMRDDSIYDFNDSKLALFNTVVDKYCVQKDSPKLSALLELCKKTDGVLKDEDGLSTLMVAAAHQNQDVFNKLKPENYVEICKETNKDGFGLLHFVCFHGDNFQEDFVEQLARDVDVNAQTKLGLTPLMLSAMYQNEKMFNFLCSDPNINVNIQDKDGLTALMHAIKSENIANIRILLARSDIDLNAKDEHGCTALMHAIASDNDVLVNLLVQDLRLDINAVSKFGVNSLQLALMSVENRRAMIQGEEPEFEAEDKTYCNAKMVRGLIDNGAKVTYKENGNIFVSLIRIKVIAAMVGWGARIVAAPLALTGIRVDDIINPVQRLIEGGAIYGRVHQYVESALTRLLTHRQTIDLSELDTTGCYVVSNWGVVSEGKDVDFKTLLGEKHKVSAPSSPAAPGDERVVAPENDLQKLAKHRKFIHRDQEICKILDKTFVWPWTKSALRKARKKLLNRDSQTMGEISLETAEIFKKYQEIFNNNSLKKLAGLVKFGNDDSAKKLRSVTNQIVCGEVVADLDTTRMAFALSRQMETVKKRGDLEVSFTHDVLKDDLNTRLLDSIAEQEPSASPTAEASGVAMRFARAAIPSISHGIAAVVTYGNDVFSNSRNSMLTGIAVGNFGGAAMAATVTAGTTVAAAATSILLSTPVLVGASVYGAYQLGSYVVRRFSCSSGEVARLLPENEVSGMLNIRAIESPTNKASGKLEITESLSSASSREAGAIVPSSPRG